MFLWTGRLFGLSCNGVAPLDIRHVFLFVKSPQVKIKTLVVLGPNFASR